ncbi:suppressor of fused domain protein [Microbacterium sp. CIAB417]|uniref:suppressor of fused domain protein n=1 Tax=Microbacterium sp. CIAB417 TaxID=2860287 RepID=UPI001FADCFF0|nr:suppressor of fused domain protein [Microbacterium sp. CIAB417]
MPNDLEKSILRFEQERLGTVARVTAYNNVEDTLSIPVALLPACPQPGLTTVATIGLSQYDNGLTDATGQPLRVEMLATGRSDIDFLGDVVANAALNVASEEFHARPGVVFPGVFGGYSRETTTPHALLWHPFPWGDRLSGFDHHGLRVEWLLLIPLTDAELGFIATVGPGVGGAGSERLVDAFEQQKTDVWDYGRRSAV